MKFDPILNLAVPQDDAAKELHYDVETRSVVDVNKCGTYVYAEHSSTSLLCLSYAIGSGPVQRWFPGDPVPQAWVEAANDPSWTVFAHNAPFEMVIGKTVLAERYGFPIIPDPQYRCTMGC